MTSFFYRVITAITIALFILLDAHAQQFAAAVSGYVYDDINQNGQKDANEPGVKGVVVSDQVKVVQTDAKGYYEIDQVKGYGIVFISTPDGFAVTKNFWQRVAVAKEQVNFGLTHIAKPVSFTFIQASDTHISESSIERMNKLRAVLDSVKPNLVIITGDLVKDALRVPDSVATSLYQLFVTESNKVKQPLRVIPGNHEIFGIERQLSLVSSQHPLYGRKMYRHYLGPDYYSFNYGGVHFIGLNSLEFEDLWYYGSIDSVQMEWLRKDVGAIAPSTPIVTFQHVPFFSGGLSLQPFESDGPGRVIEKEKGVIKYRHIVSNAEEVMTMLKNHNYPLALAGHYHYQQKFSMAGVQTRFEQTGAVIGPVSESGFNMPSGVVLYKVQNGVIDEGHFIELDKK